MDVQGTLARYRSLIDDTLSGGLDRIIRRGAVADSLAYGNPTGQVALPRYAPGLSATGAPASSEEALGDLMLALRSRPSGTPGQSPAPPDFGRIYANRAQNQLAQQALMDERAVREVIRSTPCSGPIRGYELISR